jgi:alpha-galactosidase
MDWVPKFGQLARHSRDTLVFNSTLYWPDITGWDSVMFNYGQEVRLARYQRPGYFNDPDFLNVDHFDYTMDERKTHFALWSSLSAPLIISAWIPGLNADEIEYLINKDIIAVDQDPLALQATLVSQDGTWDVLTKNLANGDRLLTVLNRGNFTASNTVSLERIGIPVSSIVRVKNLWTGSVKVASREVTASNVPSHGTAILRISGFGGSPAVIPTGMVFNTYSLNVLSVSSKSVQWVTSTGSSGQVWQTRSDGTLRSISDTSLCLTDLGAGDVGLQKCTEDQSQRWDYHITGNLKSRSSHLCLTEALSEAVTTSECLFEANSQVFGLPSGVIIQS